MTESSFTSDLLQLLKRCLGPKYTVLKHSDRFTATIPDFSVSDRIGHSVWYEVKILKNKKHSLRNPKHYVNKKDQLFTTEKLGGFYIVVDPFREEILLIRADHLSLLVFHGEDKANHRSMLGKIFRGTDFAEGLLRHIKDRI